MTKEIIKVCNSGEHQLWKLQKDELERIVRKQRRTITKSEQFSKRLESKLSVYQTWAKKIEVELGKMSELLQEARKTASSAEAVAKDSQRIAGRYTERLEELQATLRERNEYLMRVVDEKVRKMNCNNCFRNELCKSAKIIRNALRLESENLKMTKEVYKLRMTLCNLHFSRASWRKLRVQYGRGYFSRLARARNSVTAFRRSSC